MALTQVTTHGIKDATVATADISNDSITSAKIISNSITSSELANGAVTNTEVASDAAIAGSKISPNFGSQNVTTTGNAIAGQVQLQGSSPRIEFDQTDHNTTFRLNSGGGTLQLQVSSNNGASFSNAIGIGGIGNIFIPDNDKVNFGGGNDLVIVHDGSDSKITNKTGNLLIEAKDSETGIKVIPDGSVELYHDNSKKFETTSAGATVTGDLHLADNNAIKLGSAQEVQINHTGSSTNFIVSQHYLNFQANGTFFYNQAGNETKLSLLQNGAVSLYYDNSKKLETTSTGVKATGRLKQDVDSSTVLPTSYGVYAYTPYDHELEIDNNTRGNEGSFAGIFFNAGADSDGSKVGTARISAVETGNFKADLVFGTRNTDFSEKLRIRADGDIRLPNDNQKLQIGAGQDLELFHNGSASIIRDNGTGNLQIAASAIQLTNNAITENMLIALPDGEVKLYYDNSKKLETNSSGVNIVGSLTVNGSAISGGGISDIVEDTSPQLGGDLQSNGNDIDFADNDAAFFGTGNDLKIFHSGSHSQIVHSGTGNVFLDSIGGSVNLRAGNNAGGVHNSVICNLNEDVELYYDNVKKFETTSTGGQFFGKLHFNDGSALSGANKVVFGDGEDLQIYHDGNNSFFKSSTGTLYVTSGSHIDFRTTGGSEKQAIFCNIHGAVELYHNNSKKLETTSSGVNITGELNLTDNQPAQFGNSDDLQVFHNGTYSFINNITSWLLIQSDLLALRSVTGTENYLTGQVNGATELYYDNTKKFETTADGISVSGKIMPSANNSHNIGSADLRFVNLFMSNAIDLQDSAKVQFGNSDDFQLYHDGSNSYIVNDTAALFIRSDTIKLRDADNNEDFIECFKDGGVRLYYDNVLKFYTDSTGNQLNGMQQCNQGSNNNVLRLNPTSVTYNDNHIKIHATRGANSGYNFCGFDSGHGGTADREFTIRGDGNAYADGTWNNNGADYAEFFESSTGSAIAVGTTVVLENNKVRASTSSDAVGNIIGVVRPKEASQASMTIGNTAWNKWQGKYLTDDFDRYILEEHNVIEWTDADGNFHNYESHAIPSNVNVPSEPTIRTQDENGNKFTHYRLNPNYNSERTYLPRHDRDEWVIVGLVGQVKVLKGQAANDRWIKMRDVSDTVQEYFIR